MLWGFFAAAHQPKFENIIEAKPYDASVRLEAALTENNIPHEYIVFEHSGHGLQNDNKQMVEYSEAILDYLERYMSE